MNYEITDGGIKATLNNHHVGWILKCGNGKWTYKLVNEDTSKDIFDSEEDVKKAFECRFIV